MTFDSWQEAIYQEADDDQRERWFWAGLTDHLAESAAEGLRRRPDVSRPEFEGDSVYRRVLDFSTDDLGKGPYRLRITVEVEPIPSA